MLPSLRGFVAGAGLLALAGCATEVTEQIAPSPAGPGPALDAFAAPAPKADLWRVPTLTPTRRFAERPRATSFAGAVRLREPAYTNADLSRNFLAIALRAEAADTADEFGDITLAKWVGPVRYALISANATDRAQVAALSARLHRLTGLDIAPAGRRDPPNIEIWFVAKPERTFIVDGLVGAKSIGPRVTRLMQRWRDTDYEKCLGLMATDPVGGAIQNAVILIKDELPRRIRNACIVEEIVQSLGLMNDDRRARPSIFNDDQRYLDLTSHDEYLLRVLYDPRIRPGMNRRQVAPISRRIIEELRPSNRGGA